MDPELLKPIVSIMAMLIPFFVIWTKHQRKMEEIRAAALSENNAQAAARAATLEERVRVLEAIVTDKSYDVAGQIEALRGTHHEERSTKQ